MRLRMQMIGLSLVIGALCGCTSHPEDEYRQQAQVVTPIVVPQGAALKPGQTFYPVPISANDAANVPAPSLIPPGSNLQRFNQKS